MKEPACQTSEVLLQRLGYTQNRPRMNPRPGTQNVLKHVIRAHNMIYHVSRYSREFIHGDLLTTSACTQRLEGFDKSGCLL